MAAGLAHQPAAVHRGDQHAAEHREQQQTAAGRGQMLHALLVDRQVGDGAVEGDADEEAEYQAGHEVAGAEQVRRQDRLGGPALDHHGGDDSDHRQRDQTEDGGRAPRVLVAAPRGEQDHGGAGHGEEGGTEVVDAAGAPVVRQVEPGRHEPDGDGGDRHVEVERPAPGGVVGERAAEQRTTDGGDRAEGGDVALVLAALLRGSHDADHRHHAHHQSARADALESTEGDQRPHGLGDTAEYGTDREDQDRGQEQLLAAEEVAHPAPERGGDGGGQDVCGDDPGKAVESAEVTRDGRQSGGDDHRVEHGEQEREHQPGQHSAETGVGAWRR